METGRGWGLLTALARQAAKSLHESALEEDEHQHQRDERDGGDGHHLWVVREELLLEHLKTQRQRPKLVAAGDQVRPDERVPRLSEREDRQRHDGWRAH